MARESDEDLEGLLDNKKKHVPEAIEAAIAELQKRGRVFTAEELHTIRAELKKYEDRKNMQPPAPVHTSKSGFPKAAIIVIIAIVIIAAILWIVFK